MGSKSPDWMSLLDVFVSVSVSLDSNRSANLPRHVLPRLAGGSLYTRLHRPQHRVHSLHTPPHTASSEGSGAANGSGATGTAKTTAAAATGAAR